MTRTLDLEDLAFNNFIFKFRLNFPDICINVDISKKINKRNIKVRIFLTDISHISGVVNFQSLTLGVLPLKANQSLIVKIQDRNMMAKRPVLKMNNFDNGDEILLKANEKETHYQGYAVYFKKHVTTVQAKGV